MFTAMILIGAAGLAVVVWREVLAPMGRLLELSEDLSGMVDDPQCDPIRASRLLELSEDLAVAQAGSRLQSPTGRRSLRNWFFPRGAMKAHELVLPPGGIEGASLHAGPAL